MKRFDFKEHTADILAVGYGDTLEEAYAATAEAMFDVITDSADIHGERPVRFEVDSIDREGLLVGFLSHLILLHETERIVMNDFAVIFESDTRLTATGKAEDFNEDRHGGGSQVKGVSYHMMEIHEPSGDEPASAQVLFDI
jgi:SHS2 domain-containing protein